RTRKQSHSLTPLWLMTARNECRSLVIALLILLNNPPTPVLYTLSLHDALPISPLQNRAFETPPSPCAHAQSLHSQPRLDRQGERSEEHTSELQSLAYLVCRLLLEKKTKPGFPVALLPPL